MSPKELVERIIYSCPNCDTPNIEDYNETDLEEGKIKCHFCDIVLPKLCLLPKKKGFTFITSNTLLSIKDHYYH